MIFIISLMVVLIILCLVILVMSTDFIFVDKIAEGVVLYKSCSTLIAYHSKHNE